MDASSVPTRSVLYTNAADFMEDFVPGLHDLVLMDIYMPNEEGTEDARGVEVVRAIRSLDPTVPIASATTSTDFALEGFRLKVNRYIEKPVGKEDVEAVLTMAQPDPQVFVRCHKSCLANLTSVEAVDEDLMVLRMRWGGTVHVRRGDVVRTRRAWQDRMFQLAQARSEV